MAKSVGFTALSNSDHSFPSPLCVSLGLLDFYQDDQSYSSLLETRNELSDFPCCADSLSFSLLVRPFLL